MKIKLYLSIIILIFVLSSCNTKNGDNNQAEDSTKIVQVKYHNTKTFYAEIDGDNAILLTDTIIYEVIVKKDIEEEEWSIANPQKFDSKAFANIIFNAIYSKRLIPYHFINGSVVPISEIKEYEKKFRNSTIGQVQFREEWYFDEIKLEMYKKINAITFGYEVYTSSNEVYGYEALFTVYLDNPEKNTEKLKIEN